ncbi:CPBP family intramembrane glutamic endopeptidase [Rubeoparvulum massiliense]|uniref:CPBP family intramembrane glutamic endopeptidase n=1 Tax=Rubeoparvulum massiliense TaxID=1631346 RepID=UPI00065E40A0|nr:CPBP family intramembrane glutamic endopeptidase [Rubeoparvulum massiliense]
MKLGWKAYTQNPIAFSILLFVVFILVASSTVLMMIGDAQVSGELSQPMQIKEAYSFHNIQISYFDYAMISFPQNGYFIPGYNQDGYLEGIFFWGEGIFQFHSPDGTSKQTYPFRKAFLPMDEASYQILIFDLDLAPIPNPTSLESTITSINSQRSFLYFSYNLFGYTRYYPAQQDGHLILLEGQDQALIRYWENQSILLQKEGEKAFHYQHPSLQQEYPVPQSMTGGPLFIISLFTMALIATLLLTTDIISQPQWKFLVGELKHPPISYLITIFLLFAGAHIVIRGEPHYSQYIILLILYSLLIIPYLGQYKAWQYLGFHTMNLPSLLFAAVVLAILMQGMGAIQFPTGIKEGPWTHTIGTLIHIFFFTALIQELFWRVLFQNTIERYSNPWIALLLTTLAITISNLIFNLATETWLPRQLFLQSMIIIPLGSLITGLFYQRTRNIWATSLFTTLLIFLPQWLQF